MNIYAKNISFLNYLLFFLAIFMFGLYLFHLQATLKISSDLTLHLNFIDSIFSKQLRLPHEGFEYSVYVLAKVFRNNYFITSTILLAIILVISASIKLFLLKRLAKIKTYFALIFAIPLMVVSAICLPIFNNNLYLGQGSPTVWHNPTLLCVKPFAFLCVYLTVIALDSFKRKLWGLLSILLFISFFYKPSFGVVFIPALGLYLLCGYTKDLRAFTYFSLMITPSLIFFTYQLQSWILLPEKNNSIFLSPFGVIHLYTSNAFISFILATAYPLFFMLINPKRVLLNRYLTLSWIMLAIGYLQFALLAETQCYSCANFSWGFLIALDLVFVFSFIELIAWINEVKLKSRFTRFSFYCLITLFLSHFISGLYYLGNYIATGNYM